jgi:hypothetical protein
MRTIVPNPKQTDDWNDEWSLVGAITLGLKGRMVTNRLWSRSILECLEMASQSSSLSYIATHLESH